MTNSKGRRGRLQLVMIALVFFGPLLIAYWLYFVDAGLQPEGRTNHGALLQPVVSVRDALPASSMPELDNGRWLLVYANSAACEDDCKYALYTLRQSRLMIGREMDRLQRVFLHGATAPDTVFLTEAHAGLVALRNEQLTDLLDKNRPAGTVGGYFLVDPLGNLVMYFRADTDPADMVEDIKRLLKLSRIG